MLSASCSRPATLTGLFEQREVLSLTNSPITEDNAYTASKTKIMPLSSCDWKLLDFRSFICFDVVYFGNGNMAFIRACIGENGDSDARLSWLSGSYLKGWTF